MKEQRFFHPQPLAAIGPPPNPNCTRLLINWSEVTIKTIAVQQRQAATTAKAGDGQFQSAGAPDQNEKAERPAI